MSEFSRVRPEQDGSGGGMGLFDPQKQKNLAASGRARLFCKTPCRGATCEFAPQDTDDPSYKPDRKIVRTTVGCLQISDVFTKLAV
jgi:hypothetical protein